MIVKSESAGYVSWFTHGECMINTMTISLSSRTVGNGRWIEVLWAFFHGASRLVPNFLWSASGSPFRRFKWQSNGCNKVSLASQTLNVIRCSLRNTKSHKSPSCCFFSTVVFHGFPQHFWCPESWNVEQRIKLSWQKHRLQVHAQTPLPRHFDAYECIWCVIGRCWFELVPATHDTPADGVMSCLTDSEDTNPYFLAFSASFIMLHSVRTSFVLNRKGWQLSD